MIKTRHQVITENTIIAGHWESLEFYTFHKERQSDMRNHQAKMVQKKLLEVIDTSGLLQYTERDDYDKHVMEGKIVVMTPQRLNEIITEAQNGGIIG